MSSEPELILASLTAILGYRSCVHGRPRSHLGSVVRSIDDPHEENTYGLPEGKPIARELRRWFRRQREAVLAAIPSSGVLPMHLPNLKGRDWVDPMVHSVAPILAPYWDDEGKKVYARLGLDPSDWKVTNPHLRHAINSQAFNFCRSTNESTSEKLDVALDRLKHELVLGLVEQGESIPKLTKRVRSVFKGLTKSHAETIARTEASRAQHAAQEQAAIESGVVAGKELLISADACPICQKIAAEARRVRLGQAFAVIGSNPTYAFVKTPPLHPNCQCSMIDILLPEYGGPAHVDWAETLDQPQEGLGSDYSPPQGKEVPQPEPARLEAKPKVKVAKPKPEVIPEFTFDKPDLEISKILPKLTEVEPPKVEPPKVVPPAQPARVPGRLTFTPGVSDEARRVATETIKAFPRNVKQSMADYGVRFNVGKTVVELNPHLDGVHPRGWPPNLTWEHVEGVYNRDTKNISIGETKKDATTNQTVKTTRFAGTLRHESGHAFDASLGYFSRSAEFIEAYEKDESKIADSDKKWIEYFLQKGHAGRSEVFAEIFAHHFGGGSVRDIRVHFPSVLELMKGKLS